jgi:hypothetical protein
MIKTCADCKKVIGVYEKTFTRTDTYGSTQYLCESCFNESAGEYYFERQFLAKVGCLTPILGFIVAIIGFVFWGWKICLLVIAITIGITFLSSTVLQKLIDKMWLKKGIDTKNLQWCKTCKYFRKIKDWEFKNHYSKEMLSEDKIPCQIFTKTKDVWLKFFNTPEMEKTLYPKNYCPQWVRR